MTEDLIPLKDRLQTMLQLHINENPDVHFAITVLDGKVIADKDTALYNKKVEIERHFLNNCVLPLMHEVFVQCPMG